jgi:hypothetical protein
MNFGLLGDYDALPDLDRIADGIEASLAELVALARRRAGGGEDEASAPGPNGASANGRSGAPATERSQA